LLTQIVTAVAGDQPGRRRHRHHEHHARLGDRAHARDRHPARHRRGGREVLMQFLVEAVVLSMLGGVIGLVSPRSPWFRLAPLMKVPTCSTADQPDRLSHLGGDRRGVRLFPGAARREPQSDRRATARISAGYLPSVSRP
jgi:hypothetical protein